MKTLCYIKEDFCTAETEV